MNVRPKSVCESFDLGKKTVWQPKIVILRMHSRNVSFFPIEMSTCIYSFLSIGVKFPDSAPVIQIYT